MPQFERRLYEPSGEAGSFDAGEDELDEEGSRLPLLIVIALVVLASFAGVVWLAYTQGVQRGREDAPRVAAAPQSEKVASQPKAANPYSNLKIYQPPSADEDEDSAPEPPTAVAPRATPTAPPITGQKPATAAVAPKPAPTSAAKLPSKTASAPSPAVIKPTITAKNTAAPTSKPTTAAPPPTPASKGTSRLATAAPRNIAPPPATVTKPMPKVAPVASKTAPVASAKVAPVIAKPVPKATTPATITPKSKAATVPVPAPKSTQTAALPRSQSSPAQPQAPENASAAGGGGYVLQIGSYKSEAEANTSWQAYKGAHPAASGFTPNVRRAELGAKGTWYRLRVGPFANLTEANAACAKLKASGGSCFPAKQ